MAENANQLPAKKDKKDTPATSPRIPKPKEVIIPQNVEYTQNAVYRIGVTIAQIMSDNSYKAEDMLKRLDYQYFPDKFTISRLVNHEQKRTPNAAQLFELRRAFGIDLNALADGDIPLSLEQLSNAELTNRLEQIAAELSRRFRHK